MVAVHVCFPLLYCVRRKHDVRRLDEKNDVSRWVLFLFSCFCSYDVQPAPAARNRRQVLLQIDATSVGVDFLTSGCPRFATVKLCISAPLRHPSKALLLASEIRRVCCARLCAHLHVLHDDDTTTPGHLVHLHTWINFVHVLLFVGTRVEHEQRLLELPTGWAGRFSRGNCSHCGFGIWLQEACRTNARETPSAYCHRPLSRKKKSSPIRQRPTRSPLALPATPLPVRIEERRLYPRSLGDHNPLRWVSRESIPTAPLTAENKRRRKKESHPHQSLKLLKTLNTHNNKNALDIPCYLFPLGGAMSVGYGKSQLDARRCP